MRRFSARRRQTAGGDYKRSGDRCSVCVCAAVCTERICSGGGESRKADRCHKTVGADLSDAREMTEAVEQAGVRCGVIYLQTNNPVIEVMKKYFQEENSVSWRFTSRIGSTTILRGTAGPRTPKKMVAHSWTLCCII